MSDVNKGFVACRWVYAGVRGVACLFITSEDANVRLALMMAERHRLLPEAAELGLELVRTFTGERLANCGTLGGAVRLGGRQAVGWQLRSRQVVRAFADGCCVYTLTRDGDVVGWQVLGSSSALMGVGLHPTTVRDVKGNPVKAAQLEVAMLTRRPGERVVAGSAYAVDVTGLKVWGCGIATRQKRDPQRFWHRHLVLLQTPPAAVRRLLVVGIGRSARGVSGDGWSGELMRLREEGDDGIGPLALLVDGTLWSPIRAARLPLDIRGKVFGMTRDPNDPARIRLLTMRGVVTARLVDNSPREQARLVVE